MSYGETPFKHVMNQIFKLHITVDPHPGTESPDIPEEDLKDVFKCCLIRGPTGEICIAGLLPHPYVPIQTHPGNQKEPLKKQNTFWANLLFCILVTPCCRSKPVCGYYSHHESHNFSSSSKAFNKWVKNDFQLLRNHQIAHL